MTGFFSRFSPSKPQSPISNYDYTIEGSSWDSDNDIGPRPYLQTMGTAIQSADSHGLGAARYPVAASMGTKGLRSRRETMVCAKVGSLISVSIPVHHRVS
jgi:hypothetical protein